MSAFKFYGSTEIKRYLRVQINIYICQHLAKGFNQPSELLKELFSPRLYVIRLTNQIPLSMMNLFFSLVHCLGIKLLCFITDSQILYIIIIIDYRIILSICQVISFINGLSRRLMMLGLSGNSNPGHLIAGITTTPK